MTARENYGSRKESVYVKKVCSIKEHVLVFTPVDGDPLLYVEIDFIPKIGDYFHYELSSSEINIIEKTLGKGLLDLEGTCSDIFTCISGGYSLYTIDI